MKRWLSVFSGLITTVLVAMLVAAAALAWSIRGSPERIPTVMGHKALSVLSGSMEPAIRTGDVIIIRPLGQSEAVREGDVITFRVKDQPEMLITHRVVGILSADGGPPAYLTRGDATAASETAVVNREQVLGRLAWRVPYFGYIVHFVRTPAGIMSFVVLPGLILIGLEVRSLWQMLTRRRAAPGHQRYHTGG